MAVRPVCLYPDPVLKRQASHCTEIGEDVLQICQDLVDTMAAHKGCVGLAAPQIGELQRIVAVNVEGHRLAEAAHGPIVLINPRILEESGREVAREGCLSLPDITANVARAARIRFAAMTPDGSTIESFSIGFEARALLHEIDHLEGVLILDRVASASEIFPRKVNK